MDQDERQKLAAIADQIESIIGTLQFQVLNNVDTYISSGQKIDRDTLDSFIKKPIMQSVTKLRNHKVQLVKMAIDDKTTESKEVTNNAPRR